MGKFFVSILKVIVAVLAINLLASFVYTRLDLTEDKRYTLSEPAVAVAQKFETPVIVDVLLDGNIPAEFAKLKTETIQLLKSFESKNSNIKYNLVDPMEDSENPQETVAQLQSLGLQPANVNIVEENGKVSNELVFPWAMVNYNDQTVKVPLLKNKQGTTAEERINNSVQQLEYAFADAFTKLSIEEKKSIAVIKGEARLLPSAFKNSLEDSRA